VKEKAMQSLDNLDAIKLMVNTFYTNVRNDAMLGPIFEKIIQDRWQEHLEKMYRFWQTILLNEHSYFGSPFPPHAKLPIDAKHFERWLSIFNANIDKNFSGPKADEAKWRAERMAAMFTHKLDFLKKHPQNLS
jgi:hemoglobin